MMNLGLKRSLILLALCVCLAFVNACSSGNANVTPMTAKTPRARQIIFMVPDGMGLADVTAARIYKNGLKDASLSFETLPYIGYQRTYSKNAVITDSAAAASAWAIGMKVNNNEISCIDNNSDGACDETPPKTILELARDKGMSTGLVATSTITNATPAVWGAHVHTRYCESQIFRQYIENTQVDVILGGGIGKNVAGKKCTPDATDAAYITDTLIEIAKQTGYTYIRTRSELEKLDGKTKVLGLFSELGITEGLTPEYLRSTSSAEPTLADMTAAALKILEKDENGFFLMVEGSQIDWANHANNVVYQIKETLAFDMAVRAVLNWLNADSERQKNTLLIIVADHETGGFAINGPAKGLASPGNSENPYAKADVVVRDKDGNPVMLPNFETGWTSAGHTGVDTLIWSNSVLLGRAVDNTYLYSVMKDFLK
jgi:alkaline phosphatase